MIFLVLSGKMVFFPKNILFLPWAESERRSFSGNTWKYDNFCVHVQVLQTWRHVPLSKKSKMVLSLKNTPKGDDVLDWHHSKSSSISLYFHGDLYRRFHALLSIEEKQETQYVGLKFEFLNLFRWRYSTMNNFQYFVPFSPQGLCLEVDLSSYTGNYLSIRR